MPAPKQLHFVLIIVLLTIPMVVCAVIAWFVWSHTWADQLADQVSTVLPGQVAFGEVQLASVDSYAVSDVVYEDAGISLRVASIEAAGFLSATGARKVRAEQWQLMLKDNCLDDIQKILTATLEATVSLTADAVAWNNIVGDIFIDGTARAVATTRTNSDEKRTLWRISAAGDCSLDAVAQLRRSFPDILIPLYPQWLSGETIQIESFSLEKSMSSGLAGLESNGKTLEGAVQIRWRDAQAALHWQQSDADSSMRVQCRVQNFSDARVPNIIISDNILSVYGQQWWTDVVVTTDENVLLLSGRDAQQQLRSLRLKFQDDVITCVFENIQNIDVADSGGDDDVFGQVYRLPEYFSAYAMQAVNISGSSYVWNEQGQHAGHLSLQWKTHQLSGQWTMSAAQGIKIPQATFVSADCEIYGDLQIYQQQLLWKKSRVGFKEDSLWSAAYAQLQSPSLDIRVSSQELLCTLSEDDVSLKDSTNSEKNSTSLTLSSSQQWNIHIPQAESALINVLAEQELFSAGTFTTVQVQSTASELRCTATALQASVAWPCVGWSPVNADMDYTESMQSMHTIRDLLLHLPNGVWLARSTNANSANIYSWHADMSLVQSLFVPIFSITLPTMSVSLLRN